MNLHVRLILAGLALASVLNCSVTAKAVGVVAAWDTNGLDSYGPSPWSATSVAANSSVPTGLTRGSGITTGGSPPADVWGGTGFDSTNASLSDAVTDSEFATLAIQPTAGYEISFDSIDANFRRSSTGPNTFQWQYDIGSGFVDIGSSFSYTGTETNGAAQTQVVLTGIPALQNLQGTATFRLVPWGATSSAGNWGLGRLSGNDLAFNGTVSLVPEPTSAALLGIALVGLVAFRRRQR